MPTPCLACPLRARACVGPLDAKAIEAIQSIKRDEIGVRPGAPVLREGRRDQGLYTVLSGLGLRHATRAGGARRAVGLVLPGDLLGLQPDPDAPLLHGVEARTGMTLCRFDRDGFLSYISRHPAHGLSVIWQAAETERFPGGMVDAGPAQARLARAVLRLHDRLAGSGLADEDGSLPLPYRQQELSEVLGLSLVHTNKTLAKLRDGGLVIWSDGRLRVPDRAALADLAGPDVGTRRLHALL